MNTIKKLYLWAEKLWFSWPQKLRFVLVGGFNTVVAYGILYILHLLLLKLQLPISDTLTANIALFLQYAISVNISFLTMRYYVFQSHGVWQKEYVKALSVYLFTYLINAPIVSGLMICFDWPLELAQAVYLIFEIIITFLLHKYYSFRPEV